VLAALSRSFKAADGFRDLVDHAGHGCLTGSGSGHSLHPGAWTGHFLQSALLARRAPDS